VTVADASRTWLLVGRVLFMMLLFLTTVESEPCWKLVHAMAISWETEGIPVISQYLLTPVIDPAAEAERKYNEAHMTARNCIERANGILKRHFPALKYGLRLKLKNTLPVIVAAVVVNIIALTAGDQEPPADEQLEEFIEHTCQAGVQVHYDPVEVGPPTGQLTAATTSMRQAVISSYFT